MLSERERLVILNARMSAGMYSKAFVMPDEIEAIDEQDRSEESDGPEIDYASELRDQFAAAALTGILICKPADDETVARRAWAIADAMLAARDR